MAGRYFFQAYSELFVSDQSPRRSIWNLSEAAPCYQWLSPQVACYKYTYMELTFLNGKCNLKHVIFSLFSIVLLLIHPFWYVEYICLPGLPQQSATIWVAETTEILIPPSEYTYLLGSSTRGFCSVWLSWREERNLSVGPASGESSCSSGFWSMALHTMAKAAILMTLWICVRSVGSWARNRTIFHFT